MTVADTTVGDRTRLRWPGCSLLADVAEDSREGNAPPARQWLLIEHPGPWARLPLNSPGLDSTAMDRLKAWAEAESARIVLIRRPGRRGAEQLPRQWIRVDSRPGREQIRTGTWSDPVSLAAAAHGAGTSYDDVLALVCTHGRHDACCAVRGRPLSAALAATDPAAVWECSHIGGCRFAPALVLLPHGLVLGGVEPGQGPAALADYRRGMVRAKDVNGRGLLRGRSALPRPAQAAQAYAREATGTADVNGLRVVELVSGQGDEWRVRLLDPSCEVVVRERGVHVDRPLTCASPPSATMRVFELVSVSKA
ncbi:sucrase ferredoxin [Pseudonocardia ailaonensis]|uniref:Sucrase ferredoxin n=1 Tax=Pseudonocardia ailaonensis TaxID=367279 RepID=A0ABN2NPW0_9PSEU